MACTVPCGEAFGRAGIPWDGCGHEDRGDGVLILVPAELPKGLLVESLPFALVAELHAHNAAHPGQERIRLRMALHAGEVNYDEHGVTAASVNLAFRLLEAVPLKEALAESSGVLAVIASSWFFEEVVRHSAVAAEAAYRAGAGGREGDHDSSAGSACPDQRDPSGQAMLEHRVGWSARRRAGRQRRRCARCRATRPRSRGVPASWTGWLAAASGTAAIPRG